MPAAWIATTRYDLHTRLEAMPKSTEVCHGDFDPSNIIIKSDGTPYILDWGHVTQGNAAADVARTYLLFWLKGDIDGAERVFRALLQKKRYGQAICTKMDAHCCRRPIGERQRKRAGIPLILGKHCRI